MAHKARLLRIPAEPRIVITNMKLLMENWRQYVNESDKSYDCGPLYIVEGGTARETSFYDALHLLSENENAIETFLENWERSVDYHIEKLDENALSQLANNPVLYLSTQAFMFINRVKEKVAKYAEKIMSIVNKIRSFMQRFEEKHPTLYKLGAMAIKIIIAAVSVYLISYIMGGGEAQAGQWVDPQMVDGEYISNAVQASEGELRAVANTAMKPPPDPELQKLGQELLNIADNPTDVRGYEIGRKAKHLLEFTLEEYEKLGIEIGDDGSLIKRAEEVAAELPDVPDVQVTNVTMQNKPAMAQQALMSLIKTPGDPKAVEILQQLSGDVEMIQGVDFANLDREGAGKLAKKLHSVAWK